MRPYKIRWGRILGWFRHKRCTSVSHVALEGKTMEWGDVNDEKASRLGERIQETQHCKSKSPTDGIWF